MRKILVFVLVLTVASLIGASLVQSFAETRESLKGTSISILHPALEYDRIGFEMFAPRFEKKYGVKVNYELVPYPKMREKSLLECAKKTGRYDIIGTDCMWIAEFVMAGYLEEMGQYIRNPELYDPELSAIDDFVPRIFAGHGEMEGGIYSYPFSPGMHMLAFNRPMFQEKGLSYPVTFDDFREVVEKLTNTAKGEYGYVCQAGRGIEFGHTWLDYMYNFGGELVDENWNSIINSPGSLESLKLLIGLRPFTPPGTGIFGWDEAITSFESGKGGITMSYAPFNMLYEDPTRTELAGKVDYGLLPKGPARRQALFGSWGAGISVDSKNKEAAFLFLQFMTSRRYAKEWALKGGAPSRHSVFSDPEIRKKWRWLKPVYEYMLWYANPDYRPRIPEWAEIADIIGLWGNRAWMEEVTPEKALEEMQKEINVLLKGVGYQVPATAPPQNWRDLSYYDKLPSEWAGLEY